MLRVRMTTMFGFVQTHAFLFNRHTQKLNQAEDAEEHTREGSSPRRDHHQTSELGTELHASAALDETKVDVGAVTSLKAILVRITDALVGGEGAHREETPHATDTMNWERIQRIVYLQLDQQFGGSVLEQTGNHTNDHRSPAVHNRTAAGDGDEAAQKTVQYHTQVHLAIDRHVNDEGGRSSESRRKGRIHRGKRSHTGESTAGAQGRSGVETVPAEPQDERAQRNEHQVVTLWLGTVVVEAT
mmetsp:Transcript_49192/g.123667  ORF Transcript_49192/g.123667 Transcript_49192/m.123667 type:complete len:243 (+) Transcript_49192:116-844(+)